MIRSAQYQGLNVCKYKKWTLKSRPRQMIVYVSKADKVHRKTNMMGNFTPTQSSKRTTCKDTRKIK